MNYSFLSRLFIYLAIGFTGLTLWGAMLGSIGASYVFLICLLACDYGWKYSELTFQHSVDWFLC